jgi:hypothetical protein
MKLSESTLNVLKNFSAINKSIYFKPGKVLQTISESKEVLAKANINDEIPVEFGIHDLNNFLGVVSMYKDSPELTFKDNDVVISGLSGRSTIRYRTAAKEVMVLPPDRPINTDSSEIKFTLSSEDFDWIIKSANVLQSPNIVVSSDGKQINIETTDVRDDASSRNTLTLGENSEETSYKMIFRTDKIKVVAGAYDVSIKVKGSGGVAHFVSKTHPLEYWVTTEPGSVFGE